MCLECTEGEHREHVTVPLRDVLEQHKTALKNQLDAVRNRYALLFSIRNIKDVSLKVEFFLSLFLWQTTSADSCH